MAEKLQDMSVSTHAAVAPQKQQASHEEQHSSELPEAFARPSADEVEVARELVASARSRGWR